MKKLDKLAWDEANCILNNLGQYDPEEEELDEDFDLEMCRKLECRRLLKRNDPVFVATRRGILALQAYIVDRVRR